MKINIKKPSRKFRVGSNKKLTISHVASLKLKSNEQITFVDSEKKEYDVVKKSWGYYATPSVNDRLKKNNYKTAIVKNKKKQIYVMIVKKKSLKLFEKYIKTHENKILYWLDDK